MNGQNENRSLSNSPAVSGWGNAPVSRVPLACLPSEYCAVGFVEPPPVQPPPLPLSATPPVLPPPLPLSATPPEPPPFFLAPPVVEPSAVSVHCQPLARSPVKLYAVTVGLTALGVWVLIFSFGLWMRSADEIAAPSGPAVEPTPEVLIQSESAALVSSPDKIQDRLRGGEKLGTGTLAGDISIEEKAGGPEASPIFSQPLPSSRPARSNRAPAAKPEPTTISLTDRRPPEKPPTHPFVPTTSKVPPTKPAAPPSLALQASMRDISKNLSQNLAQKSVPCPDGSCKVVCTSGICTPEKNDRTLGTALTWVESAAGSQAKAEDKLVFLLHVSGNFAREEFT